ncbi:unnamed protein product [Oppiella nova]|uniref:TRPM SLOG domain-containing protein n=1 Tax=Oppiella nova TaxID=334625 RepID=A0A7R9LLX9_9ACAR|nr:unnamed protein product [Oppiella nova]CAG2164303.1 unnamed protein product [Oppiella nova]
MDNKTCDNKFAVTKSAEEIENESEVKAIKEEVKTIITKCPQIQQISSISFKDSEFATQQSKPMVRCVHNISIDDLIRHVIHKRWKLMVPRIVVFMAAENTNMWLIANGVDMGSTTMIGDAVRDYVTEAKYKKGVEYEKSFSKFNFIGIADEEMLKYSQTIVSSQEPTIMVSTGPESRVKPEKYELNQNLTHYILIKDETTNKSGVNSFLIKLITFLAQNQSQTLKAKQKLMDGQTDDDKDLVSIERNEIPVVSIVIKGGYNSSRLVLQQIKNSLPVVVLRGSGGLADLLAFVDNEIRDRCMNVWNADFVETYLKDPTFVLSSQKRLFENSLLRTNCIDFVDLFLSQKFKIRTFITPKRVKRLFRKIHSRETVCWETILGRSPDERQSSKTFINRELNWLAEASAGVSNFLEEDELDMYVTQQFICSEKVAEKKSLLLLVLWAVLDFRKDLVAQKTATMLADSTIQFEDGLKNELKEESQQFVTFASNVLDICYKDSFVRTSHVLNESSKEYSFKRPLDLAAFGRFRQFFTHPSCQRWLTDKFYGNISVRELRINCFRLPTLMKLLLSAYLLFPIYFWVRLPNYEGEAVIGEEDSEDEDEEVVTGHRLSNSHQNLANHTKNLNDLDTSSASGVSTDSNDSSEDKRTTGAENSIHKKNTANKWKSNIKPEIKTFSTESIMEKLVLYHRQPPIWLLIYECTSRGYKSHRHDMGATPLNINLNHQRFWTALIIVDDIRQAYIMNKLMANVSLTFRTLEIGFKLFFLIIYTTDRVMTGNESPFLTPYGEKILLSLALLHAYYILKLCKTTTNQSLKAFFSLLLTPIDEARVNTTCDSNYMRNTGNHTMDVPGRCYASSYSLEECRSPGVWSWIFFITYFLLLKIILNALLFAIFAASSSRLAADTDTIWKFQRYGLVMEFTNRTPLPPPLNFFYYCYWMSKWFEFRKHLAEDDYTYFRLLATQIYDEHRNHMSAETMASNQYDHILANSMEMEVQRRELRQLKGKQAEMERLLRQTSVNLEYFKHFIAKKTGMDLSSGGGPKKLVHIFSRQSPYPNTTVHRYPVSDKYVSWDVMWVDYDPIAYTKPRQEFGLSFEELADEDILALQVKKLENPSIQLPVYEWNRASTNAAGISVDRQSWEICDDQNIIYKLDNGIPVNPFGRTGLRGKGALLRWGPNHYVMLVITRIKDNELEVLAEKLHGVFNKVALPVCFIGREMTYTGLETLFRTADSEHKNWKESEKMVNWFQSFRQQNTNKDPKSDTKNDIFKCERLMKGYFDDPLNTDQAWKEMELWHIHYTTASPAFNDHILDGLEWREVSESFFSLLSISQSNVIQEIVDKLKINIR